MAYWRKGRWTIDTPSVEGAKCGKMEKNAVKMHFSLFLFAYLKYFLYLCSVVEKGAPRRRWLSKPTRCRGVEV